MAHDKSAGDFEGRTSARDLEDGGVSSGCVVDLNSSGASIRTGNHGKDDNSQTEAPLSLTWKERVRHLTWTFFTLIMATGGIANVLNAGREYLRSHQVIPRIR